MHLWHTLCVLAHYFIIYPGCCWCNKDRTSVPKGALPKLRRVLTPLWGKATPPIKKKRLCWRCASLLYQLICHHMNMLVPWAVSVDSRCCGKNYWISKIYTQDYIHTSGDTGTISLDKIVVISEYTLHRSWTLLQVTLQNWIPTSTFHKSHCVHGHKLFSSCAWSQLHCVPMELLLVSYYIFNSDVLT